MKLTTADFKYELESYIDKYSLADLCEMIARICYEKAEHLRSAWQDEALAESWEKTAIQLEKIS